jgi:CheY-like chemotaxis protein/HPt (histidine-containing phosphotransfer) domain-containing protein
MGESVKKKWPTSVRVLIAEDNAINQKVAIKQLQKFGVHADAVGNGLEALEALRQIKYDLVLMDCQMPEMDGYSATQQLRKSQDPRIRDIPVIAITGNALQGDRERCLKAGMSDYLSKPIKTNALLAVLERWLGPPSIEDEPGSDPALDPSVLDDLRKLDTPGEPSLIDELGQLFLSSSPKRIQKMRECLDSKDFESIKREAHQLKSTSGNLGASSLSQLCEKLETLDTWDPPGQANSLLEQIQREYQRVHLAIQQELTRVNPAKEGK